MVTHRLLQAQLKKVQMLMEVVQVNQTMLLAQTKVVQMDLVLLMLHQVKMVTYC